MKDEILIATSEQDVQEYEGLAPWKKVINKNSRF